MSKVVEAVFDHINADAGVTALVNGVYPLKIPHGTDAPAVTYSQSGEEQMQLLIGAGDYKWAIFDVDCWATTYAAAVAIADAVEAALIDYRGTLGTTTPSVDADHIRLERRGPDQFEEDTLYYRVPLQFFIGYEEV